MVDYMSNRMMKLYVHDILQSLITFRLSRISSFFVGINSKVQSYTVIQQT
jgi:hypothetical protein